MPAHPVGQVGGTGGGVQPDRVAGRAGRHQAGRHPGRESATGRQFGRRPRHHRHRIPAALAGRRPPTGRRHQPDRVRQQREPVQPQHRPPRAGPSSAGRSRRPCSLPARMADRTGSVYRVSAHTVGSRCLWAAGHLGQLELPRTAQDRRVATVTPRPGATASWTWPWQHQVHRRGHRAAQRTDRRRPVGCHGRTLPGLDRARPEARTNVDRSEVQRTAPATPPRRLTSPVDCLRAPDLIAARRRQSVARRIRASSARRRPRWLVAPVRGVLVESPGSTDVTR